MEDSTKRGSSNLNSYQEEIRKRGINLEQRLQEAMEQKVTPAASVSNPAGSVSGFGITVSNSVVRNAKVVVGWADGISYINSEGEQVSILSQDADLLISQTNADGVALFPRISPEWIIDDYSLVFKGDVEEPIKLYAPIYSYGGEQDTGYDPIPLASNFSMRNVNPITTVFTSLFTNRSLQEVDPDEVKQVIEYLGEWIEKDSFTEEEIEEITTGRVKPDLYANLIEPIKKSKDLFQGLGLSAEEKLEIEVAGDTKMGIRVEISKAAITAAELSGIYKFNEYAKERYLKGLEKSNRRDYTSNPLSNGYVSRERAAQLLGYSIADDAPVTEIVQSLYKKETTKETFVSIKTTYSEDLVKDDNGGGNNQRSVIWFNGANASDGEALVYGSDSIKGGDGEKICSLTFTSSRGEKRLFKNVSLTVVSEDDEAKKYVYSLNLYEAAGLMGGSADMQIQITAETTNNRTQATNTIILVDAGEGKLIFQDYLSGSLIPSVPGKGDPGQIMPPLDGPIGNLFTVATYSKDGYVSIGNALVPDELSKIGGKPSYTFTISETTYYVYWDGERWVIDGDTDPIEVLASGSSNSDNPAGDYVDSEGNRPFAILASFAKKAADYKEGSYLAQVGDGDVVEGRILLNPYLDAEYYQNVTSPARIIE